MNITVSYKIIDDEYILQIDRNQEIRAGLDILVATNRTSYDKKVDFFLSERLGKTVSAYITFDEAGIFSGDALSICRD